MCETNDHELALLLQLEYDTEIDAQMDHKGDKSDCKKLTDLEQSLPDCFPMPETPPPKKTISRKSHVNSGNRKLSIIDPSWELLDPIPDIHALFLQYDGTFFWSALAAAEVRWSPRMTLCAGLCVYERRGGFCSIRLSAPLLKLRPRKDLVETLLHEMIHAYLFLTNNNKDHDDHGPEFKKHMQRINDSEGTSISVYHSFHDEVDSYRQHWWRCDGPCKNRKPFFGWVKRCMNRAPSARDTWWAAHQTTCGGTYTKVKEPEGYKKKGEKKTKETNDSPTTSTKTAGDAKPKPKPKASQGKDIRNFLTNGAKSESVGGNLVAPPVKESGVNYRQKQSQSADVIDNIGKGLGSKANIKSATNFLNLTEKTKVGDGVGREGNIHSVGKFLKGESTKDAVSSPVSAFAGSGSKLGGSVGGRPVSGCHASRLLTAFGPSSSSADNTPRGQKRRNEDDSSDRGKSKKVKPIGIRNSGASSKNKGDIENDRLSNTRAEIWDNNSHRKNRDNVDFFTSPSSTESNATPGSVSTDSGKNENVSCPVCGVIVPLATVNDHLNNCLS